MLKKQKMQKMLKSEFLIDLCSIRVNNIVEISVYHGILSCFQNTCNLRQQLFLLFSSYRVIQSISPKKSVSTSQRQIKFFKWSCLVKFLKSASHGITSAPQFSEGASSISAAKSYSDSFLLSSSDVLFSGTGSQFSRKEKQVEIGS